METDKKQKRAFAQVVAMLSALTLAATLMAPASAYAYTQKETICNQGHGSLNPDYLVIHETANPGASAYNHYQLYSRGYSYAVQYVMELDGSVVYHTMADNRKAWAAGNGNSRCVNIELAHATNRADFDKQWNEAVKWAGDYLNKRGWGIDRMISHNDARLRWGGSDHTDPLGYFMTYGKSWNMFKAAVRDYMGTGQVGGVEQGTAQQPTASASSAKSMGTYTTTASALCVRKGPGTGYARVSYGSLTANAKSHALSNGCLKQGTRVTVMEVRGSWARIPSGWVCTNYLAKAGSNQGSTSATASTGTYRVTASALNVRTGAGQGYGKVSYRNLTANAKSHALSNGCLKQGTRVTVMEVRGSWARIPSGWVSMDYLARA